jgi:hypothetical protein
MCLLSFSGSHVTDASIGSTLWSAMQNRPLLVLTYGDSDDLTVFFPHYNYSVPNCTKNAPSIIAPCYSNSPTKTLNQVVTKCDSSGYFLKYFSLKNTSNLYFLIFKNYFFISIKFKNIKKF